MSTIFKDVVKYGADINLQYDPLHRGQRLIAISNGVELTPYWLTKTDEEITEAAKVAIENITNFTFIVEEAGSNFNVLPDGYRFGPKDFAWQVHCDDGVVTEEMIEAIQLEFFKLQISYKEIKMYVETYPSNSTSAIPENKKLLPTLNEAIIEFYGDRKVEHESDSYSVLLTILNNELSKTASDDAVVIQPYAIVRNENENILTGSFSIKVIVNKLADLPDTAESELNDTSDFVAGLGFNTFHTFWLRTSSERFVV